MLRKKNVDKLGRIGDCIVKVKKGYARNCLLPKGLATNVSPANLKQIEKKDKDGVAVGRKREGERLKEVLEKLSSSFLHDSYKGKRR